MPDEAPWADHVVVPDDLRELQPDVDAYHREQRIARRRSRWAQIARNRFVQRLALPAAILVGSIGLAAVVFVVLTFGHAGPAIAPTREPLASPSEPPGSVRGLLPDVSVLKIDNPSSATTTSIREMRPALFALVPLHCGCSSLLDKVAGQAYESGVQFVIVAPTETDAEVSALPGEMHAGNADAVFDPAGALAAAYKATGVTALVVAADGTVQAIVPNLQVGVHLESKLSFLTAPQPSVTSG